MELELEVRSGPDIYACGEDILQTLEEKLAKKKIRKLLVVHGEKSWDAAQPYFPSFQEIEVIFLSYNRECSDLEIERISTFANRESVDAIMGIGGGRVIDLVKSAGNTVDKEIILLPTLPSNCAAWTPLSVIYSSSGEYVRYDIHLKSTWIVLIEPRIFLTSPISYFRAGVGDTLNGIFL